VALQAAVDSATTTGTHIERAQAQGAEAKAAAVDRPAAVAKLDQQHQTLTDAAAANQTTLDHLKAALDDNATLKASNATLQQQLAAITAAAAAKDKENADLRTANTALEKKIHDAETAKLHTYFGLSLALLIAGIAGAIWIPAPAKTIALAVATVGAVGIGVTIFLIAWMAVFKWVVLVAFVGLAGYSAFALFRTHGALTKTSEGVEGIKQDLSDLAASHPGTTVAEAAGKVLTDWFGTDNSHGVFHRLHSEYETIVASVRRWIGSKPAAIPAPVTPAVK
jgi:hypothetical protein